jgi:hypothetical protein
MIEKCYKNIRCVICPSEHSVALFKKIYKEVEKLSSTFYKKTQVCGFFLKKN